MTAKADIFLLAPLFEIRYHNKNLTLIEAGEIAKILNDLPYDDEATIEYSIG